MYYVRYVESCSPKIRCFFKKDDAAKFVANFMLKYQFINTDDNWIESVFNGDIIYLEPTCGIEDGDVKTRKKINKRS